MTNDELKAWMTEHITGVRPSFSLGGILTALLGAGYSVYSGSVNDMANTRRLDEAIAHIERAVEENDKRATEDRKRIWDAIASQRREIKDDIRYEKEHGNGR